jgi:tRNA(adenine34) deaminase
MNDAHWMQLALQEAQLAAQEGEVPVGAVVVRHGQLLATGRNASIRQNDPTAHAEVVALRAAAQAVGNYRLDDATLYVTLEPCPMCAGALLHARVKRVVFAAADPKTGAAGSVLNVFANTALNHQTQVEQGVLADACAHEIKQFFQARRVNLSPLRDDALRTPDSAFAGLIELPSVDFFTPIAGAFDGLRMAYTALGGSERSDGWLLLHSIHNWRYVWRHMLPALAGLGHTVLAPDLMGCGQSDKPKKATAHSLQAHADVLLQWLGAHPPVQILHIVCDPTTVALAEHLMQQDSRVGQIIQAKLINEDVMPETARLAPFPDRGHQAALKAMQAWPAANVAVQPMARIDVSTPDAAQEAAQYLQSFMTQTS